jgi:hypothetical protein
VLATAGATCGVNELFSICDFNAFSELDAHFLLSSLKLLVFFSDV